MKKIDVREIPPVISDSGKVRMGAFSPAFPPPMRGTSAIHDVETVRIGDVTPAFPQVRSR